MGLLELLIVILLIAWLLGAFAFPVGSLVHVLLFVVLLLILLRFVRGRRVL
jgi:hypothetical protein